jgi:hypothetical protein
MIKLIGVLSVVQGGVGVLVVIETWKKEVDKTQTC